MYSTIEELQKKFRSVNIDMIIGDEVGFRRALIYGKEATWSDCGPSWRYAIYKGKVWACKGVQNIKYKRKRVA